MSTHAHVCVCVHTCRMWSWRYVHLIPHMMFHISKKHLYKSRLIYKWVNSSLLNYLRDKSLVIPHIHYIANNSCRTTYSLLWGRLFGARCVGIYLYKGLCTTKKYFDSKDDKITATFPSALDGVQNFY